jgi:hypothetical protein
MKRVLLLCFIHGFKGNDDTFQNFPEDLKKTIYSNLEYDHIESVVYPKYETKGELAQSTEAFLGWYVIDSLSSLLDLILRANYWQQAQGTSNGRQKGPPDITLAAKRP